MYVVFLTLFILVCLVLVIVVLLQSSKGGGLAGAFGGGGSDSSVLGGRGAATFLGKLTVYLAVSFMCLALILAILSSRGQRQQRDSVISERRNAGELGAFQVDESGSIYDDIQTEGFDPGTATESPAVTETPADVEGETDGEAAPVEEPAPAGN